MGSAIAMAIEIQEAAGVICLDDIDRMTADVDLLHFSLLCTTN